MDISAATGVTGIELRNDLSDPDPLQGMLPEEVKEGAAKRSLQIVAINALQRCNALETIDTAQKQIKSLIDISQAIDCTAIVLCPVNEKSDRRSERQKYEETVTCLKAFAPQFNKAGITGLLEPLGFSQSSLHSHATALKAIDDSGASCYRILLDTFHFALGTTTITELATFKADQIGLVHASGVDSDPPQSGYSDAERVFLTDNDHLDNVRTFEILASIGYQGPVSLECFSADVQNLEDDDFVQKVHQSFDIITSAMK